MFCNECGKPNPDYAKFCAYCGAKLIAPQPEPEQPPAPKEALPPAPDAPAETAEAPYQRALKKPPAEAEAEAPRPITRPRPTPAAGNRPTARPLIDNPAQPRSGPRAPSARSQDPLPKAAQPGRPAAAPPRPQPVSRPKPAAELEPEDIPPRKAPVKHPIPSITHVPPRPVEGPRPAPKFIPNYDEEEDEDDYDEEDEGGLRMKIIASCVVLLLVLSAAFYLFATSSGQLFRAKMGWGAPAGAYWKLGDDALADGQVKTAAEAYYDALKLDPNNYLGCLRLAQAMELAGDPSKAESAYLRCISLRPSDAEPYQRLANLLGRQGRTEEMNEVLRQGAEKTGDSSLNPQAGS